MISAHFQGKPRNITVMQFYALTNNDEEADVAWFYEDLQDLLELTLKNISVSLQGTVIPTTQEKILLVNITRWSIPKSDRLYPLQSKWRNSILSAKTRSGADCGSDHGLLIAKFRLKLKKEEKPLDHSGMT